MEILDQSIITYHDLREILSKKSNFPDSISKYFDIIKIAYLFGLEISEILPEKKNGTPLIKGKDIQYTSYNGRDVLQLKVPTARVASIPKPVMIPLDSTYEPWAKDILDIAEQNYNKPILNVVRHALQDNIKYIFEEGKWIQPTVKYGKKKIYTISHFEPFSVKNLKDVRMLELVINHGFTPYDLGIFFREARTVEDFSYLEKLCSRKDVYLRKDVERAVILQNMIFNPDKDLRYNVLQYVDIYKLLKKGFIKVNVDRIPINSSILKSTPHDILKKNMLLFFKEKGDNEAVCEKHNYDVISYKHKIVVECGQTYGNKLIELFSGLYSELTEFNDLWVLDFYDPENISLLYKFKKTKLWEN